MTREEAIKVLITLRIPCAVTIDGHTCERNEAINMAIFALSAECRGEWIPLDGELPKIIGHHVLVTIKWADGDLEVCEMCPTVADRYNIIAFQDLPEPYQGEQIKSELQCCRAKMEGDAE